MNHFRNLAFWAGLALAFEGCTTSISSVGGSSDAAPGMIDTRTAGTGGAGQGGAAGVSGQGGATGGTAAGGNSGAGQGGRAGGAGGASLDAGVAGDVARDRAGTGPDVPPATTDGGAPSILVPSQGALLGAFIGSPATVASREALLGRKLAIVHNFFGWADDWVARARSDAATGRVPLITWIPNGPTGVGISLDDIINGLQDAYITTRAQAAKAVGQKFFLRWGHEMNGNWTNWNASKYGSNAAGAAKFAQAWQHIHNIFTSVGATNVLWVFCPNVNSVPVAPWNTWQSYYPGDAYVDWVAYDGYNFGTGSGGSGWTSFAAIANGIYSGLAATGKPIMIAEMSSSESGGDKAAWISAMLPALKGSFPAIRAIVWFDAACGGGFTWCIDSSPQASAAFVSMALDPYFNP